MLSINLLSWNRPYLLNLTIGSLVNALEQYTDPYEIIVLDQGSNKKTKTVLDQWSNKISKLITLDENIGIAGGFNVMFEHSNGAYILPLENDWFYDSNSPRFFSDAISILNSNPKVAFVKLRSVIDRDNYGYGLINHAPWTLNTDRSDLYEECINKQGCKYYKATSKYISYTFNPVIMCAKFRSYFGKYYKDDINNSTPLRSGEDLPSKQWRKENYQGCTLLNGPFKHIGFHRRKDRITMTPYYTTKYLIRRFINAI